MFVHTVFFWLKRGISAEDRADFESGLQSLLSMRTIRQGLWGRPADTDRPVIDRTYDYGLTTIFSDKAGHDAYQEDPVHKAFVERCSRHWIRVVVYDCACV
jgi:hypothetical protein